MPLIRRHPVCCIFLLALVLRLGAVVVLQHVLDHQLHRPFLVAGDADGYWSLAGSLVRGEEYSLYTPPRRIHRTPGFPLVLAFGRWVGGDRPIIVRCWLAVVGAVASALVCWWGCRWFGNTAGWLAGGFTAVAPLQVGFSVVMLSETTFALCLVANLVAAGEWLRCLGYLRFDSNTEQADVAESRGDSVGNGQLLKWAVLTGLAAGATCLVRPGWLPAVPAFLLLAALSDRGRWRSWLAATAAALACFLLLLPWGLRNQRVSGHFVLTSLWSGPSLYDGLHPQATGSSDMRFFDEDQLMSRMTEYEMNREYTRRAGDFVRSQPGRAAELAVIKLGRYFSPWLNADGFQHPLLHVATTGCWLLLMGGACVGIWQLCGQGWCLLLTLGPLLYFAVLHAIFIGSVRYRVPTEYPLAILAAVGWLTICRLNAIPVLKRGRA